jgi:hypothetical protein
MALCGAPTGDGTPCRRRVKRRGQRCYQHRGFRAVSRPSASSLAQRWNAPARPRRASRRSTTRQPPPWHQLQPSPAAPVLTRGPWQRQRIREAAEYCADTLSEGWEEAVASRLSNYAESAWTRLAHSRRRRDCRALARIAAALLQGRLEIHRLVGQTSGFLTVRFGADEPVRAFIEELASNIPLGPIDVKTVAVARGIQVAGILLCLMDGRKLTRCQCFIDLAIAETKERVDQILVASMSNWINLARFTPRPSAT